MTQTAATYSDIMFIDHDPRELSRTAIKLVAWVTFFVTTAIMIAWAVGLRFVVDRLPDFAVVLLFGLMIGFFIGFKVGWWDRSRHLRTVGKDE